MEEEKNLESGNEEKNLEFGNPESGENNNYDEESSQRKIEVVTGDGNLTISPVYEHLEVEKPKPKENRTIVIPEVKKEVNEVNGQGNDESDNK